jgi:hypothetical protein
MNTGRSEFFAENFSVAVGIGAVGTVIARMTIPSKCTFRLLEVGNYIGTVAAWSLITWHATNNGIPLAPLNAILDQIGYAAQRSKVENLIVTGGSVFSITADNAHAAIVNVGISLAWELIYQE